MENRIVQLLLASVVLTICHLATGQSVTDQAALLSAAAASYPQAQSYVVGYPSSQQQQQYVGLYPGSQLYGNAYLTNPAYNHLTRPLYPRVSLTTRLRNMMKSWLKSRNYPKPYYQPSIPGLSYGKPEHISSKPVYVSASSYKPVSIPYHQAQKYYKPYYAAAASSQRGHYVAPQYSSQQYVSSGSSASSDYPSAYSSSVSDTGRGVVGDLASSGSSKYNYATHSRGSSYPVQASYSTGYQKTSSSVYKPSYQTSSFQPVSFSGSQSNNYKSASSTSSSGYSYDNSNSGKIA